MASGEEGATFHPLFERWARRVRARMALRYALTCAALGLAASVAVAAAGWKTRHDAARKLAPALGVVGGAAGLAIARRKRWSDAEVALFLDDRLESEEAIVTAVELARSPGDTEPSLTHVVHAATRALADEAARSRARLGVWKPVQLLAPVSAIALVAVLRAPLPPTPPVATPPGTTKVQLAQVEGLEKAIKLRQAAARDDAQRERLEKIAKDAEKLKEELARGIEKRDAQDRIARLHDDIDKERMSLGDGEQRQGLESAVSKLEENDATKRAAKALGDHDLESVDQETERIANEREKADRELAKKAL